MAISLIFAFAGCGASDAPTDADIGTAEVLDISEPETLEEVIKDDPTLEAYIHESLAEDGVELEINGNTMVYSYALPETYDAQMKSLLSSELEAAMDEYGSQFESAKTLISDSTGINDIVIEVIYEDASGAEIYSKTF